MKDHHPTSTSKAIYIKLFQEREGNTGNNLPVTSEPEIIESFEDLYDQTAGRIEMKFGLSILDVVAEANQRGYNVAAGGWNDVVLENGNLLQTVVMQTTT